MPDVEIHVTEGTVPCVWRPSSDELVEAGLVVGAGFADELLADHGLTHLAEHLIFGACRQLPAAETAYVTTLHTAFFARGTADDVAEFFAAVSRAMADLPVDRLDHEVQVLTAERRERPPGALAELDARRFGPNGPGLATWPEFGLRRDADALRSFVAPRFVAPRAAAWLLGPEPLELSLPEGTALDPDARSIADRIVTPAWTAFTHGSVVLSGVVGTSWGSGLATGILSERLMERLRHEDAAVYADTWSSLRIGGERLLTAALIETAGTRQAERAVDHIVEVLDQLASDGPTEQEFTTLQRRHQMNLERPAELPSILHSFACHAVERGSLPDGDGPIAALLATTPEAVRDAAAELRASLLLGLPASVQLRVDGIDALHDDTLTTIEGERFASLDRTQNEAVVISDEGIGVAAGRRAARGVRFDSLVAGVAEPGGWKLLITDDGSYFRVRPANYERGTALLAALKEGVPEAVRVEPTEAERQVESHLTGMVGSDGGLGYIRALAEGLEPGEEIRASGVARVARNRTIVVVTDHRLILLAAGRAYDGGVLRLAEISEVRHSRSTPFVVQFRAGSVLVAIEVTKSAVARQIAELLRAGGPGEPRAAETVRSEATWIAGQRTWREQWRNWIRVYGVDTLFLVLGVMLVTWGLADPNEHELLVYGGVFLSRVAYAAVRGGWGPG